MCYVLVIYPAEISALVRSTSKPSTQAALRCHSVHCYKPQHNQHANGYPPDAIIRCA
nr:MAG TPA_asm: hypothetical protein [Caudoviricetes sp.]